MRRFIYLFCLLLVLQGMFVCNVFATTKYSSSGYKNNSVYPMSIKIKKDFGSVRNLGQEYQLNIEYYPTNTTEKDITWSSSDNSILTIDKDGKIKAKKRGTVKVTAKTVNGKTDSITISVLGSNTTGGSLNEIKSISITNAPKQMVTGESFQLNIQTSPQTEVLKQFTYKSSNKNVLKVNSEGVVEAVGSGKATITVKTNNNKEAKVTIEVKDYEITLSQTKISGYEGDVKKITATINSKKTINPNTIKWYVTSINNASVKLSNITGNTYEAEVKLKKNGNTEVKITIGNESAKADVKIKKVNIDSSIECPIITYDTSNNDNINLSISPSSSTLKYDIDLSSNKWTGKNASWINYVRDINGKSDYTIPYSKAQARIKVYDKNGNIRYCYTAPFDLNNEKNSGINISYIDDYITLKSNVVKIDKVYLDSDLIEIKLDNMRLPITYGANKVYYKVNYPTLNNYQYSWIINNIDIDNYDYSKKNWTLLQTFDQHYNYDLVLNVSDDKNYASQGVIVTMNDKGDTQTNITLTYSSLTYYQLAKKSDTLVLKKAENCIGYNNTLNYINTLYKNEPYLFKNKMIVISGKDAVTYGSDSNVNLPCNDENTYIGVIHEMAHVWDRETFDKYMYRISNLSSMKTLMSKYNDTKNVVTNDNLYCPYTWYYDQKTPGEFFVGIYTHYYLDKYYRGRSSSEIDQLHIHDCWKWMLKNKPINSDVKKFVEDAIKKYK